MRIEYSRQPGNIPDVHSDVYLKFKHAEKKENKIIL